MGNEIVYKETLAPEVNLIKVKAPRIARKAKSGQFVILRATEDGEKNSPHHYRLGSRRGDDHACV